MKKSLVLLLASMALGAAAQEMPSRALEAGTGTPVESRSLRLAPIAATAVDVSSQMLAKRAEPEQERRGLIRVGGAIDVQSPERSVEWRALPDGGAVAHLEIRSAGAAGLRTQIVVPADIVVRELRATSPAGKVEGFTVSGNARDLWTPYTDGDTQTIEIEIAAQKSVARSRTVNVAAVMVFDTSLLDAAQKIVTKEASGSCNPDVSCNSGSTAIDAALAERKKSVAHLNFRSGGQTFICTGTLINSDKFPRPFLLTADHCISTAAEAASLTTFWFKENVACGQLDTSGPGVQVAGGAQLQFANFMADSTLLELNSAPPDGAVFSGWNAAPLNVGDAVVSVSHPHGDPMKFALGVYEGTERVRDKPYDMYGIRFTRGVVEGGSSGSGIFTLSPTQGLQLRGVLSGTLLANGGLTCTNLADPAVYGRFEVFYQNIRRIIASNAPAADGDANQIAGARDLALGGTVTARIDYGGDMDVFRVVVPQEGHLTIGSTGGNDMVGALLDASGSGITAEDDVERSNNEFGITHRVSPGTYYVSVAHFDPAATTGNYQVFAGFSTATDNYSDSWWNAAENGWGIALNHQDNTLAGAIYTYDTDGQPLFFIVNGATRQPDGAFQGPLVRYSGPAFNTLPWPASAVVQSQVGTIRLTFASPSSGQISYTIGGITVNKSITRLKFGSKLPDCTFLGFDRSNTFQFQDIWWNPSEPGWGLNIVQQDDIIVAGLYTFDATGRNMWLLMQPGLRQSSTNSIAYQGDLNRFNGPVFNSSPWPSTVTSLKVGTMRIDFTDGNRGTMVYTINGTSVTKQIQRLVFGTPRTSCENPD